MGSPTIKQLIISSPYEEPSQHWSFDPHTRQFILKAGRRPASFVVASADSKEHDAPGTPVPIPRVDQIRQRVKEWREAGYPGATAVTRRLLAYWMDPEEFDSRRFYYCQIEAAETLMWLTEGPQVDKVGLDIPSDGGDFRRLCAKMATGSGKTVVMAMVLAWHILNKVARPNDRRFSKNVLIVAPGLTVRDRLAVLVPTDPDNYYDAFHVVPPTLADKLHQGKVVIRNWHALAWESPEKLKKKRSVDKRGAKSDEAYVREVLGDLARARNILVINDEAHHAWRVTDRTKRGIRKTTIDQATKWVGALDRIHRARGVRLCYDFTATPFVPIGKRSSEDTLFEWIVSDFGLNDAIESGLVKTPRVVVRDDVVPDAKTYRSRLYHIYNDPEVKEDLNRKAPETAPLPDLVTNAYYLLGYDWRETLRAWKDRNAATPPVIITVANRTHTAARIKYAFDRNLIAIAELCDAERTMHIDSTVLQKAETRTDGGAQGTLKKADREREHLREMVNTVGKPGKPGEKIQNVISVGMLSEGWDAKTVTHIMGLRAFSSQLLCEQVVGRGLRRTSYDVNPTTGRFEPEYVNIFGIPFSFLPHEHRIKPPPPVPPKVAIEPVQDKATYEITWPNVLRINTEIGPHLSINRQQLPDLTLHLHQTTRLAELAPILDGAPHNADEKRIELDRLAQELRMQSIIFDAARRTCHTMQSEWKGGQGQLFQQLVGLIEQFVRSGSIVIKPATANADHQLRRLILTLNMNKVVQHICRGIRCSQVEKRDLVFDQDRPIRTTGDMRRWFTGRPCEATTKSHVNYCVYDSTWERSDAYTLDHSDLVEAWVKNDHLGFEIAYIFRGVVRKYRPDFLVRLKSGDMLVLETKGKVTEEATVKRKHLQAWVEAVNEHGGFGRWHSAMTTSPDEIHDILATLL